MIQQFVFCPKCREKNQSGRTVCWLCEASLSDTYVVTDFKPQKTQVTHEKPKRSLAVNLLMAIGSLMLFGGLGLLGLYGLGALLLSVTCPGNSQAGTDWQGFVTGCELATAGLVIVGISKYLETNQ